MQFPERVPGYHFLIRRFYSDLEVYIFYTVEASESKLNSLIIHDVVKFLLFNDRLAEYRSEFCVSGSGKTAFEEEIEAYRKKTEEIGSIL